MPPYANLAYFRCDAARPEQSEQFLGRVRQMAEKLMTPGPDFGYLGPLPGPVEKRRDLYRFTLLISAVNRSALSRGLDRLCRQLEADRSAAGLRWSVDVDPQEMI